VKQPVFHIRPFQDKSAGTLILITLIGQQDSGLEETCAGRRQCQCEGKTAANPVPPPTASVFQSVSAGRFKRSDCGRSIVASKCCKMRETCAEIPAFVSNPAPAQRAKETGKNIRIRPKPEQSHPMISYFFTDIGKMGKITQELASGPKRLARKSLHIAFAVNTPWPGATPSRRSKISCPVKGRYARFLERNAPAVQEAIPHSRSPATNPTTITSTPKKASRCRKTWLCGRV